MNLTNQQGPFGIIPAGCLRHNFEAVDGGTQYTSMLAIGPGNSLLRKILMPKIEAKQDKAMWARWFEHNVVEVGLFEKFLPFFYNKYKDEAVTIQIPGTEWCPNGATTFGCKSEEPRHKHDLNRGWVEME